MKKILTSIILAILLMSAYSTVYAQNSYSGTFDVKNLKVSRVENKLILHFTLDMTSVSLNNQLMVLLTPVLRLEDNSQSHDFSPIVVVGNTRNKVLRREVLFQNFAFEEKPQQYVCRKNGKNQMIPIEMSLPYVEWMRDAELGFIEEVSGCANCDLGKRDYVVADRILPSLFTPSYEIQYVMPEAEEVKQRSETYAAHLNYKVGKYELLRDF